MSTESETSGGTLVFQPLPGIGDVIWHLPHLCAIAGITRGERVTLLTKARSHAKDLLAGTHYIRDVLYLAPDVGRFRGRHRGPLGGWRLGADLRQHRFETAWILHGSARYALAAWRGGIAERIGYGIGWQDAYLTSPHGLSGRDRPLKAIAKATRLLQLHNVPILVKHPELGLTADALAAAEAMLEGLPGPRIALAIGSSEAFKQWGGANFIALIERLRGRTERSIVLIGGADEAEMAGRLARQFDDPPWLRHVIDRPILDAAAAASLCQACIGNDTGMLNIAAAVGTPSIGLFGGSIPQTEDPRITAVSPSGLVLTGHDRMNEITVDMIMRSLSNLAPRQ
jgi:heptosyltransferase-2